MLKNSYKLNKNASIDATYVIAITLIITIILISFITILVQKSDLTIDEKKIKTQLIINKVFHGKCFSSKFATIEKSEFIQANLNNCFENLDESIIFRIRVDQKTNSLYSGDENLFKQKGSLCQGTNILCSVVSYPINYVTGNNEITHEKLVLEIISQ